MSNTHVGRLFVLDTCEGRSNDVRSVNAIDCVFCRLQNHIDKSRSHAGCELGREADHGRDGKHKVVRQNKVEVAEPFESPVVSQQVKVRNA